jgi:hypothetical protein
MKVIRVVFIVKLHIDVFVVRFEPVQDDADFPDVLAPDHSDFIARLKLVAATHSVAHVPALASRSSSSCVLG